MTSHHSIVGGPGKFDLMLALFDGKRVEFTLDDGQKIRVSICQIEVADDRKEKWGIVGYTIRPNNSLSGEFKASYTTRGNEGEVYIAPYPEGKTDRS